MTHFKIFLVIVVALAVIVVAVQNHQAMSQAVQFRINPVFLQEMRTGQISIYQITVISFLLGVVLTGVYGIFERFRLKKKIKMLTKELDKKDKELNSLRNLPITYGDITPEKPGNT